MLNTLNREYKNIECYTCDIVFAVNNEYYKMLVKEHKSFYCPNGHSQHFISKTEAQILNERLENKNSEIRELNREITGLKKLKIKKPAKKKKR